jgi:hypothetical protein
MFVKVYRYRVQPKKTEEYLVIQADAEEIYRKHLRFRSVHLRSRNDPFIWLEIHWYTDEKTYQDSIGRINSDPEIDRLWERFQMVLDPENSQISEENFEQILSEDNLGN